LNTCTSYSFTSGQSLSDSSDEELIRLVLQGESSAFEVLVKRYEMPLFNYIRRMVGGASDAEDLFQETFLRVYTHLDGFRVTERFRPWVYKIATNICKDHLKYRRRHPQVSLDAAIGSEDGSETALDRMEAPIANPSELASATETAELLEAAIEKLSPKHRPVFLMARYEGMPYEEIARTLGIPVGTVKSRMNKAVQFLLSELQETTK
jgi:RNA polymerase sigma-70 factor (ECF subfamily)